MKKIAFLFPAVLISPFYCLADIKSPVGLESGIAFLPVIFYLLILIVTTFKLNRDGTRLADLLTEKDPQVIAEGAAPAASTSSQSVSRYIAFLTGLVSLTIGVCLTTFYIYCYFRDPGKQPDLTNLTTIVWGLGIGVLPYGFNKASAALKPNPQPQATR